MIITYSGVITKYKRILNNVKRRPRVAIILKNDGPRNGKA